MAILHARKSKRRHTNRALCIDIPTARPIGYQTEIRMTSDPDRRGMNVTYTLTLTAAELALLIHECSEHEMPGATLAHRVVRELLDMRPELKGLLNE